MWLSKVNLEGENEMAIFRDGQKPKGVKSEGEMNGNEWECKEIIM